MTTATKMTASKTLLKITTPPKAPATPRKPVPKDAIALLRADHGTVLALFAVFEATDSVKKKKALVADICTELSVHVQIEEEIFYPAIKAVLQGTRLVAEATVEHSGVKYLISQIEKLKPNDDALDDKIEMLAEYVKQHVMEEQSEMFPKVKASSLDLVALGTRMAARRADLLAARG